MSCKDNICKYNHDGIACCAMEKIAILGGGGLLEAGGLLEEIWYYNLIVTNTKQWNGAPSQA